MAGSGYASETNYANQFAAPGYSLYVGNIDERLIEPVFMEVLHQFFPNQVVACKFFQEVGSNETYAFVMFTDPAAASAALNILNGRQIYDKKIRVNWACAPTQTKPAAVTENDGHAIYVGDLGADVEDKELMEVFKQFGEVRGAKIVRDVDTGMPKGYGFVIYVHQSSAERAIAKMNGSLMGTRPIKVSWASRTKSAQPQPQLVYAEVFAQAPMDNTTIYVSGFSPNVDEGTCRRIYEPYGPILDFKFFTDKRYAFITFETHELATNAIVRTNGMMIEGSMLRCSWSSNNSVNIPAQQPFYPPQPPGQYPPGYGTTQGYPPSYGNQNYPYYPSYQ